MIVLEGMENTDESNYENKSAVFLAEYDHFDLDDDDLEFDTWITKILDMLMTALRCKTDKSRIMTVIPAKNLLSI